MEGRHDDRRLQSLTTVEEHTIVKTNLAKKLPRYWSNSKRVRMANPKEEEKESVNNQPFNEI